MKPTKEGLSWNVALPAAEPDQSSLTQDDPQVIAALEEYLAAIEEGQMLDRQEFLARHAAIAVPLASALEGLDFIQQVGPRIERDSREGPTPASPPPAAADPGVPLGDYRIVREVGRGGMGVVYEAVQLSLGRRVALKILPWAAAFDPRQLQRFRNEAQAAAQLHHTNIVPVFGVGSERGVHYYVMQFIDGRSLAQVITDLAKSTQGRAEQPGQPATPDCQPASPVSPSQCYDLPSAVPLDTTPVAALSTERSIKSATFFRAVVKLGVQAALALEHAHQLGVVHRDIKPGNLLLDLRGNLWITDFGLARCQSDNNLTLSGDLVGTLRYMSPEQALAKHWLLDHRTDIYSLGATLYELLTLQPVFRGRDREEILGKIASQEPLRLKHWNRAIPTELETIVLKALEKDGWNRYASARELAEDLQRFLNDQPIRARRPTLARIGVKWARRHRGIVLTTAVALVAGLVLGIAGLLASNVRSREEQARTEAARQRAVQNLAGTAKRRRSGGAPGGGGRLFPRRGHPEDLGVAGPRETSL
jgi:serine/threonine protein kinase